MKYSALNYKLVKGEIVNDFGTDIQMDETADNINFTETKTKTLVKFKQKIKDKIKQKLETTWKI